MKDEHKCPNCGRNQLYYEFTWLCPLCDKYQIYDLRYDRDKRLKRWIKK